MRSSLSCLCFRVLCSFFSQSPTSGAGCSCSDIRWGQSIAILSGRVSGIQSCPGLWHSQALAGSDGSTVTDPFMDCPCRTKGSCRLSWLVTLMGFVGQYNQKCQLQCKINKWKSHLLFFLEPHVYCYLMLAAVVAVILFFVLVIIFVTTERAEF